MNENTLENKNSAGTVTGPAIGQGWQGALVVADGARKLCYRRGRELLDDRSHHRVLGVAIG